MDQFELNIFGVRGSTPIAHSDYLKYGGNTASLTLRTAENSLLFIDAGTGLKFAQSQLDKKADKVWLILSHTHLDHIIGLGMSNLPWLEYLEGYQGMIVSLIGPEGVAKALRKLYDGDQIWPVVFDNHSSDRPNMPSIDIENIIEYQDEQTIEIDGSCKIQTMKGNHPVAGCVILYKFTMQTSEGSRSLIYATDNEFTYKNMGLINEEADLFEKKYKQFIQSADILIADGQYTKQDYMIHQGFGHSYPEQLIDLAAEAEVKQLLITHHHDYSDDIQDYREANAVEYGKDKGYSLIIKFAQEGMKYQF